MDFVFNIGRGRAHELHRIVNDNVLANSAIIEVVLALAGLEVDDTLREYDTLAALLAASNNEPAQAQYNRKTWTDADLAPAVIDDALNTVRLPGPTATWTSVVAGDSWAKVLWCIDFDTTAGGDTDIIPIAAQDMLINGSVVIPAGVNIQWSVPNGYYFSG
jgi:hypothetical protein